MDRFAFYNTRLGLLKIGYTNTAVFSLTMTDKPDAPNQPSELSERAYTEIQEYLAGERQAFDFEYELRGTLFQVSVWRALAGIPYGQTRTYRQIAEATGNPRACRAVGMALSRNPLMIVIPCHRVTGTGGSLVGYAGGIELKRFLLELESRVVNTNRQN
ncbi:MAG: methylated-DNA--[protein]-cysteine S-methyltransferase [Clostridiales bacterium]|nr:methylated-DNA--[protein]-cysteine S-methyltransferase [Clostridiales bacterium]